MVLITVSKTNQIKTPILILVYFTSIGSVSILIFKSQSENLDKNSTESTMWIRTNKSNLYVAL